MSLVTIKDGIYKNRISYKVIKASYLELSSSIESRFKDITDNMKFKGAICLEYISIIYNMIYCNKPP
jgi:hypothetical protein